MCRITFCGPLDPNSASLEIPFDVGDNTISFDGDLSIISCEMHPSATDRKFTSVNIFKQWRTGNVRGVVFSSKACEA